MLIAFLTVGWLVAGVFLVYVSQMRQEVSTLRLKLKRKNTQIRRLKQDLECTEDALEYETRIATDMQEERDNAHKMLEFVLSDENLKELSK